MRHTQSDAGFSIVELLVTLAVAIFAVVSISTLYSAAGRLSDRSTDFLDAHSTTYDKLVQYQNMAWSEIPYDNTGGAVEDFTAELDTKLPAPREGKIFIQLMPGNLKAIVVRTKYGSGAQQKIIEYADYIQLGGVGR